MREVDRLMIEEYGISLLQMMENAGRNLAKLARHRFLDGDAAGSRVLVLAGPGGNGGGSLAAARHLHNAGAAVSVLLAASPANLGDASAAQLRSLLAMGVSAEEYDGQALPECELIVDGILGYSLVGDPREPAASLIRAAVQNGSSILANDVPTGIDTDSGEVGAPTIRAEATLTIALPKVGLRAAGARPLIGELYVGNISVPPELYASGLPYLGKVAPFSNANVMRVW